MEDPALTYTVGGLTAAEIQMIGSALCEMACVVHRAGGEHARVDVTTIINLAGRIKSTSPDPIKSGELLGPDPGPYRDGPRHELWKAKRTKALANIGKKPYEGNSRYVSRLQRLEQQGLLCASEVLEATRSTIKPSAPGPT